LKCFTFFTGGCITGEEPMGKGLGKREFSSNRMFCGYTGVFPCGRSPGGQGAWGKFPYERVARFESYPAHHLLFLSVWYNFGLAVRE